MVEYFSKINGVYPNLGRVEQRVANFIKNYPEEVVRLPINVLADKVGVSSSTIVRLCRRLGIEGYSDLKLQLAQDWPPPRCRPMPMQMLPRVPKRWSRPPGNALGLDQRYLPAAPC